MLVSISWSVITNSTACIFYQPNCDTHSGHDIGLPSGLGIWSGEIWMIWSSFDEPIDERVCSPSGLRNLLLGLGCSKRPVAYFTKEVHPSLMYILVLAFLCHCKILCATLCNKLDSNSRFQVQVNTTPSQEIHFANQKSKIILQTIRLRDLAAAACHILSTLVLNNCGNILCVFQTFTAVQRW